MIHSSVEISSATSSSTTGSMCILYAVRASVGRVRENAVSSES